jgi:sialate O-acetylesterase
MEMSFNWGVKDGDQELADADLPQVRLLHVERAIDIEPRDAVAGKWTPCNAETARPFSACGFFFGRALQREIGVPVGLVEDCWSGTVAETWLSMEGCEAIPGLEKAVADRRRVIKEWKDGGPEKFKERYEAWKKSTDPVGEAAAAPDFAEGEGWEDASMPFSFEQGIAKDYDGVVWARRDFDLTAEQAAAPDAVLALGMIDDSDDAFLNGTKVGHTDGWQTVRRYKVPAGVLREGRNTVALRMLDTGGGGGVHGADTDVPRLEFGDAAPALSLAGAGWRRFAGPSLSKNPEPRDPTRPGGFPNVPAACYNGTIAPLFPMAVRGAIWYQGCSNVGRAEQYKTLLPAVIGEWRAGFTSSLPDGAFPFYIVQLAAYMQTHENPVESGWAAMRWAQTQIGQSVTNSGTAVALDIGDHGDIHPKNKRAVGERLAALALAQTYGRKDQKLSPVPADDVALASGKSMQMRVRFVDPVSGKPAALKPGSVKGFQVSKDGKTFEWAEATAEGDTVTVGERIGARIIRVRYAWDDYPDCDLVSADGLPVGPFELESGPAR